MMPIVILLAVLGQQTANQDNGTQSKNSAPTRWSIVSKNGIPVLSQNGKYMPPLIFFFNSEMDKGQENLTPQVRAAAQAGIKIVSMPFDGWLWEWSDPVSENEGFQWTNGILQRYLEAAPDIYFLPRIRATAPWNWPGNQEIPNTERYTTHDGDIGPPSIGSDVLWSHFIKNLRRFVTYYEKHPLSDRIIGYHVGGPCDIEWFQWRFREVGPDYSQANTTSFRKWLRDSYGSEENLRQAWGKTVSFDTAQVPKYDPEKFPMRMQWQPTTVKAFYSLPEERDWVDYSKYISDITSYRICEAARVIKEASAGKKISVFFYGYSLELIGSFSGHNATERVLSSPDVDVFAAPVSYIPMTDRLSGGAAAAMGAVDSVVLHNKLWLNEEDMRTHLISKEELPPWLSFEAFGEPTKSAMETKNLLSRNLGFAYIHRVGTWWMDLIAAGAFDDPSLWQDVMKQIGKNSYATLYEDPFPYWPEVAVIVDENSWHYVRSDYDVFVNCGALFRNNLEKVGASVGYYYLGDFLNHKVPRAKVYVFPNLFVADEKTSNDIIKILDENQTTAIWQYAPGLLSPEGVNVQGVKSLTGFTVAQRDGIMGSMGKGRLEGLSWGWTNGGTLSPRLIIQDSDSNSLEILGTYKTDDYISTGRLQHGKHISVFFADILPSRDALRRILRDANVHIWTNREGVIRTDGKTLVAHFGRPGVQEILLPDQTDIVPREEIVTEREGNKVRVQTEQGQTVWFQLVKETR